jgi:iron(III) transport system ATP-binding protein
MLRRTDPHPSAETALGLDIRGLRKRFGATDVLGGIEIDVSRGELITVLGPSGSGKTTLLRLICGFEHADAGSIELGGRLVAGSGVHLPPEKRGIGYVAQEGALFPHLDIAENLLFGLPRALRKAGRKQQARRVGELLELVGLPAVYASRKPAALSGGEQQRVALARALAPDPAIVLLDDPFSALDAGLRDGLRSAVATSLKRVEATAVLVTHDQDEALSLADRVAVLQHGRFAQVAAPQTLYRFPANAAIARFVGEAVLTPGVVAGDIVECCFGRLRLAAESRTGTQAMTGPVDVMIRPEQFCLSPPAAAGKGNGGMRQTARIEKLTFYGHDARLALRLRGGRGFLATASGLGLPAPGQEVAFEVIGNVVAYPRGGA